jgi:dihydrofolate reductase
MATRRPAARPASRRRRAVEPHSPVGEVVGERRIIAYLAVSADGYIARPDGDVDWLNRRPRTADYGMREFHASIDTILLGRKTYDWAADYAARTGMKGLFSAKAVHYVFSHTPPRQAEPGVNFVSEPVKAFAQRLRRTPGKNIWMMGGGGLIASFLDEGEIDEFDVHVIPTFIGEGIPLVAPRHRDVPLQLRSVNQYPDGVVRLRYQIDRGTSPD